MGNDRVPFESNQTFHVYNHGNGDDNIFRSDNNYQYFLQKYMQYIDPIADTYAYCLMPNHFHFLIRIKSEEGLSEYFKKTIIENSGLLISRQFSNFLNAYVKAFNKLYDRKGSLFLDNINRKAVNSESYFTQLIHYIHANPVHHGFTDLIENWEYSSYQTLLSKAPTFLNKNEVIEWFGTEENFRKIHQQPILIRNILDIEL